MLVSSRLRPFSHGRQSWITAPHTNRNRLRGRDRAGRYRCRASCRTCGLPVQRWRCGCSSTSGANSAKPVSAEIPRSLPRRARLDRTRRQGGLPVPEAMELVTREIRPPVGAEFRRLLDELRIGTAMEEALQRAADRVRVPDFRFFVVSLLLQSQTGGGIAETLSNLSTIIRQRKALRLKARALTAEARASGAVVAALPFVAGGGLFLINHELMSVLFVDPRGRLMLGIACIS